MTTFIFLRHAESTANVEGILAGRLPGTYLSKKGEKQARTLPLFIQSLSIDRIMTSPLERCLQTVEPTAKMLHKRVEKDPSFIEMNYGKWSGKYLKDLRKESGWKVIQKRPSQFTFPQGESFTSAARRVERQLNKIAQKFPNKRILIVTHGDIIKLAAAKALNMEIDDFQRIIIDPCSITVIDWNKSQRTLMQLNLPTSQSRVKRISSLKNRRVIGGGSDV